MTPIDPVEYFTAAGLNLVAVFAREALPVELRDALTAADPDAGSYRQLLLIGNAGPLLWRTIRAGAVTGEHPIDEYSMHKVAELLDGAHRYRILSPGPHAIPLQQLGRVAGWHHDSPLGLGIHPTHGLWFAYRAVVLADSGFTPTTALTSSPPCDRCPTRPCIAACPSGATRVAGFDVPSCTGYRLAPGSPCAESCAARLACPVAPEQRYDADQLAYHYAFSLAAMRRYLGG